MKLCSIKNVFGELAAARIPWTAVDYRKYDENVSVNITTKQDTGLVE